MDYYTNIPHLSGGEIVFVRRACYAYLIEILKYEFWTKCLALKNHHHLHLNEFCELLKSIKYLQIQLNVQ